MKITLTAVVACEHEDCPIYESIEQPSGSGDIADFAYDSMRRLRESGWRVSDPRGPDLCPIHNASEKP